MGFKESLKVNPRQEETTSKEMEIKMLYKQQPSNEEILKDTENRKSRNCPENDGEEK